MNKKTKKVKLLIFTAIVVIIAIVSAIYYVNRTMDPINLIKVNWKIDLPRPVKTIEVLLDETGGFTGDGTSLVKLTYDKSKFDELIEKVDFMPADSKFYSNYSLFIKSVNKKNQINELADVTNNNSNIRYKIIEKRSGFLILMIDASESNSFTLYCLSCVK